LQYQRAVIIASDHQNITVDLFFSQPVSPDELMNHAKFYDGKVEDSRLIKSVEPLVNEPVTKITLQMTRPDSQLLMITIDSNLKGDKADLTLPGSVVAQLKMDARLMYESYYADAGGLNSDASVSLRFSRRIEGEIPAIEVKPEVQGLKVSSSYSTLVLEGDFVPEKKYNIKIPSILSSENNMTLGKDVEITVDIPRRNPDIKFIFEGGILSPRGNKAIDIKAVNIAKIELSSMRVFDNNLVAFLHSQKQWYSRNDISATAGDVSKKEIALNLPKNKYQELTVELKDLINPGPGIYSLAIKNDSYSWNWDKTVVVISDLAITTKRAKDEVVVWVTSLADGLPVKGAEVKGISYNNQTLTNAVTNDDGIARLKYVTGKTGSGIWLVTAGAGTDLNYMVLDENQWVIDTVDQSGRSWPDSFEVMLYPERGVYLPGDKIYLTGVVRDKAGKVPPVMPYELKVQRPDGKEIDSVIVKPLENGQGAFQHTIQTKDYYQTGIYTFSVNSPGSDKILGTAEVSVESYTPLRMSVKAESAKEIYDPNDKLKVKLSAQYLWGQPAGDLDAEVNSSFVQVSYKSQKFKDYSFGKDISPVRIPAERVETVLDEQGNAQIEIGLPDSLKTGLYKMYSTVAVTETGSRSVSDSITAYVDLAGRHIGIKGLASQIAIVGQPVPIEWVSVDGKDQDLAVDNLAYALYAVEYNTVLKEINGGHSWQSQEKLTKVTESDIQNINGSQGSFNIKCDNSGYYRLVLEHKSSGEKTQIGFYAVREYGKQSLAMNQPEHIEVVTDKSVYLPGEMVKVLLRSPIEGKALVTLESDHVLNYYLAEVKDNSAELNVPIEQTARGCVYISATVVRKLDPQQQDWLPHRGYGMNRITIDHLASRIPVVINSPDKLQPQEEALVTVDTGTPPDPNHPAMVHLWAVDEGILLTTNYQTPKPYEFFLSPRRPGVFSADMFNQLMPDFKRPDTVVNIGADGVPDSERIRRSSPVATKRKEADIIWNGIVPTDKDGKAQVAMKLPKLVGQLRLMATAFEQDRYGSADKGLILTRDLIAEASCPKFAAPGDIIMVPVKIFNNKTEPVTVTIDAKATGPVELENTSGQSIVVSGNSTSSQVLKVLAQESGQVDIEISLAGKNGENTVVSADNASLQFTIRPTSALYPEIELKTVVAGESLTLLPSDSYLPGTERLKIKIFSNPAIQLAPAVEKLVGYPYGCVEQTTSSLFALLYAGDILGEQRADDIKSLTQAGIARLWGAQTTSGGLSYWPGSLAPWLWGSAYSGWYLTQAIEARYEVDTRFSTALFDYLEKELNNVSSYQETSLNDRAFICMVLIEAGRPQANWLNSLFEKKNSLSVAGRVYLAAALHKAGRRDDALAALPGEFMNMTVATSTSEERMTSKLYQQAIMLSVLMEIDPDSPVAVQLAGVINEACTGGSWRNTLEDSAAVVALYRYQQHNKEQAAEYTGSLQNHDGTVMTFDSQKPCVYQVDALANPLTIQTAGTGKLYIVRASEGFAKPEKMQPYDKQISVRRNWYNQKGNEVDPMKLQVGDLVQVRLELEKTEKNGEFFENIAMVDTLPAGMEVENPRLAEQAGIDGYESDIDQADFQDDRVIIFCNATSHKQTFHYSLRVISAGSFEIPPIQASSMYDPAIASLGASGKMNAK
jgi:alpha-2-macroglobulin